MKAAIVHSVAQGSQEWLALRARHYTASEAPAMMGCSPYQTRNELLRQKAHGAVQEVSPAQQRVFDAGHAAEAAFLPHAETLLGCELYPVTVTREVEEGLPLLASMDGLSMDGLVGYEHKVANASTLDHVRATGTPPDHHVWQLEHQMLVTDAESILFVCSDGTDGAQSAHCHYRSHPERRAGLVAGWLQFQRDLANPDQIAPAAPAAPAGRAPESLPALRIEVTGMVTASNLSEFKQHALGAIRGLNRDLQTDQDFADAEKAVKWCATVEQRIKAAKDHALAQTASIDELFRTLEDVTSECRTARLALDKLVKGRKDEIKAELVAGGVASLRAFVAELNESMPGAYMPAVPVDFGNAIKGLRTVESIRNAVDSELARAKIEAFSISRQIHQNLGAIAAAKAPHLFADVAALVIKNAGDVLNVISVRTNQEAERIRAAAERIRAEEVERVEREAALRAAAAAERERERIRLAEVARLEQAAAVVEPADSPMPVVEPADSPMPVVEPEQQVQAEQPRRMSLWSINLRLSPLEVNYKTLESLGFHATYATSRATHADYLASDFPKICRAIADHALAAAKGELK